MTGPPICNCCRLHCGHDLHIPANSDEALVNRMEQAEKNVAEHAGWKLAGKMNEINYYEPVEPYVPDPPDPAVEFLDESS